MVRTEVKSCVSGTCIEYHHTFLPWKQRRKLTAALSRRRLLVAAWADIKCYTVRYIHPALLSPLPHLSLRPFFGTGYFIAACRLSRTCSSRSQQRHPTDKLESDNRRTLSHQSLKRTSNSIFASAMSCSLPLPPAIFCASAI